MDVSVIICTYNRSASLHRTLRSLARMSIPRDLDYEILIVDNNSRDDTKEVAVRFIANSGLRCSYLLEKEKGLSNARNTGIGVATGEIIAFTDDDVLVDEKWLSNIVDTYRKTPNLSCLGGKILPVWEKPRPDWLAGDLLNYLALLDLGDQGVTMSTPTLWGANLSIRSSMFRKYGLFDSKLGNTDGKLYGGEETRILQMMLDNGETILYDPAIIVHHCIPESRVRKSYFRRWVWDKGELGAMEMGDYKHRNLFGVPLYIIRRLIVDSGKYLSSLLAAPDKAFRRQLIVFFDIGTISGRLKHGRPER